MHSNRHQQPLNCDLTSGKCPECGRKGKPHWRMNCKVKLKAMPSLAKRPTGPGTELRSIFKAIGFVSNGCGGCEATLQAMNQLGPEKCREQIDMLLDSILVNAKENNVTWQEKLSAGVVALREGLPLSLRGLVLEAIQRAEDKSFNLRRDSKTT